MSTSTSLDFFSKLADSEFPSCKNTHFDKDIIIKPKKHIIDSVRWIFSKKTPKEKKFNPKREGLFDRVTRRKANDVFNTFKELQIQYALKKQELMENREQFARSQIKIKKTIQNNNDFLDRDKNKKNLQSFVENKFKHLSNPAIFGQIYEEKKSDAPSSLFPYLIKKTIAIPKSIELLKYSTLQKGNKPRSTALNTMNLIPKAYRNNTVSDKDEIHVVKTKIQTSVDKNSTKIYGIDRLVKGKIRQIFGNSLKFENSENYDFSDLKKNKKKRTRNRKSISQEQLLDEEIKKSKSSLMRSISMLDRSKMEYSKTNEDLGCNLQKFKLHSLTEELIENTENKELEDQISILFQDKFEDDGNLDIMKDQFQDLQKKILKKTDFLLNKRRLSNEDEDSSPNKNEIKENNNQIPSYSIENLPKIYENFEYEMKERDFHSLAESINKDCLAEKIKTKKILRTIKRGKKNIMDNLRSLTKQVNLVENPYQIKMTYKI